MQNKQNAQQVYAMLEGSEYYGKRAQKGNGKHRGWLLQF
jgi:hypothetical protein